MKCSISKHLLLRSFSTEAHQLASVYFSMESSWDREPAGFISSVGEERNMWLIRGHKHRCSVLKACFRLKVRWENGEHGFPVKMSSTTVCLKICSANSTMELGLCPILYISPKCRAKNSRSVCWVVGETCNRRLIPNRALMFC